MNKRILVLLLTLALLVFGAVFAVSATEGTEGDATATTAAATTAPAYEGIEAEDCPCGCGIKIGDIKAANASFTYGSNASGHYYKKGSYGPGANVSIAADATVVIYLEDCAFGKADTPTDRDFRTLTVNAGATLYIVADNSAIQCGIATLDGKTTNGNAIYVGSGATLNMKGGAIRIGKNSTGKVATGGLIVNEGTMNLENVNVNAAFRTDGSSIADKGSCVTNSGTFTAKNCTFKASPVSDSGAAFYNYNGGDITLEDCTVIGAAAANGGAIYTTGKSTSPTNTATVTIKGDKSSITGAEVTGCGGAIYAGAYTTTNLNGGTVKGGSTTKTSTSTTVGIWTELTVGGGNVYVARGGTLNVACTVEGGKALSSTGGNIAVAGSVYVKKGADIKGGQAVKGGNIYCFDNASSVTTARQARCFVQGGVIQDGIASLAGGNLYVSTSGSKMASAEATANTYDATKFEISGGEIKNGVATGTSVTTGEGEEAKTTVTTGKGGNIYMNHTAMKVTGGTISGGVAGTYAINEETGAVTATTIPGNGGNIYTDGKGYMLMSAGTVSGGKAQVGGSLYNNTNINTSTNTVISGGTIDGGEALQGGNIYSPRRTYVQGDAIVQNGKALVAYRTTGDTKTAATGGNWQANSNNQTLAGTAQVKDGYSDGNGGNIAGGSNALIIFNLKDTAVVSGGHAKGSGGNIWLSSTDASAAFNMSGGTVSGGKADTKDGGGMADNIRVASMPMNWSGGSIENTVNTSTAGSALVFSGDTLTISGNATANARETHNVYLSGTAAKVVVKANFTGEIWLFTWSRIATTAQGAVYGTAVNYQDGITGTLTAEGVFTGKLFMAGSSENKYENGTGILPVNTAAEGETAAYELYFAVAATTETTEVEGEKVATTTWYMTNEEAIEAAAQETEEAAKTIYATLYVAEEVIIDAGKFVTIDFNGLSVNVYNEGTLFAADTSRYWDDKADKWIEGTAVITVTGEGTVAPKADGFGEYSFIALPGENNTYKMHNIKLEVSSISLRAHSQGLYYTAAINNMDATLKAALVKSGVAVTIDPEATPDSLANFLYTDGAKTSVLVKDILYKNSAADANTKVYARAYIELPDGTIVMSDAVGYSLTELVNAIITTGTYEKQSATAQAYFDELYTKLDDIEGVELVALPVKDEE